MSDVTAPRSDVVLRPFAPAPLRPCVFPAPYHPLPRPPGRCLRPAACCQLYSVRTPHAHTAGPAAVQT